MSNSRAKFVVYIPAYTDFKLAAQQSRILKKEFNSLSFDLVTIISINSISLDEKEKRDLTDSCDELIYTEQNLGGDTNINLGFYKALSKSADFFWILSANDVLKEGATKEIQGALENGNSDLLVIGKLKKGQTGQLENAFYNEGLLLPLGLISAVIYKTEKFKNGFAQSMKLAWTGWGQLSVIQSAIFEHKKISYRVIDEILIYDRELRIPYVQVFNRNQSLYRHSFFGYPLIIAILFRSDKRLSKKIIRLWLSSNWFKIGLFKSRRYNSNSINSHVNVFWTENLARPLILRSGLFSPILYLIGNLNFLWMFEKIDSSRFGRRIYAHKSVLK
jgi:hypothetical protein